ncbi:hypothetical protein ACHAXT_009026 [Thalassiosira profunda]
MKAAASLLLLLSPAARALQRADGPRPVLRSSRDRHPRRGRRRPLPSFATDDGRCTFASPPPRGLQSLPSSLQLVAGRRSAGASIFALYATPAGSAEALFPSDDSDYHDQALNNNGASTLLKDDVRSGEGASAATTNGSAILQTAGMLHPTQSRVQIGDITLVDPVDVVADFISDRFVEQSLQKRSDDGGSASAKEQERAQQTPQTSKDGSISSSTYRLESYSPGSALDALARATQTYTPLSYQIRTVVRVVLPSLAMAALATAIYPSMAQWLVHLQTPTNSGEDLYNDQVLTVLSNDLSQYVQNVLTTCALLFGMLVGQTYYFMYQQQELVFYALFAEVTEAKSLLEQISLLSYGRPGLYPSLLSRMDDYVQNDLKVLSTRDPIATTSRLPRDDPLESILYATSVGLPGSAYETVKSLRQARADRCGALQRKLPALHVYCLRLLGVIVLATFPVCGSGSQAIAPNVLVLQSYMFGILAFGLTLVLNVVEELRNSRKRGAYNVDGILEVMVGGLERELEERLEGKFWGVGVSPDLPTRGTRDNLLGEGVADDAEEISGDSADQSRPSRARRIKKWLGKVRRR